MPQATSDPLKIDDSHSIVSLSMGSHVVLQQLDADLVCEVCGRETRHQIVYLGQRIAEVRCGECGRCLGMDRREVVRAFIGEVVMQVLRLPHEVTRELKEGLGKAATTLPRQMARIPVVLAQDTMHLLRMAWTLQGDREALKAIFSQMETLMPCPRCKQETPHRILYLGRRLAEARCVTCGSGIGMSREEVFSDFAGEVFLQMLKLPRHVRRELRDDFAYAVRTLPSEMVRMPFRLARDFVRLVRLLRDPRQVGEGLKTSTRSTGRLCGTSGREP
jgi:transcription elongation factor Elf1